MKPQRANLGRPRLVLLSFLFFICGCGNANEAYLLSVEPQLQALAGTWAKLNQFPSTQECEALSKSFDGIEKRLQEIKVPEACQNFQNLAFETLKLQRKELVTKQKLSTLSESGQANTAPASQEIATLAAQSNETAKEMLEVSKKIQEELKSL